MQIIAITRITHGLNLIIESFRHVYSIITEELVQRSIYNGIQDLVFSVKLQFGKPLFSVQNKFSLQKDFYPEILDQKYILVQENF